jgi:hypothetical protein
VSVLDRKVAPVQPLTFSAEVHEWDGPASWFFARLPEEVADDVADHADQRPRTAFGSVRVEVRVGASTWRTSLFPSKRDGTYLLPLKRAIRDAEGIADGSTVEVALTVLD